MNHWFDTAVAEKCGIPAAVILGHFRFWIEKNRANGTHFHDGYCWTYSTLEALREIFPYMSVNQIRTALNHLINGGYIKKDNYNRSAYDRTVWYAITEEGYALFSDKETTNPSVGNHKSICGKSQMEMGESTNGNAENHKSIKEQIDHSDRSRNVDTPPTPQRGERVSASAAFERFWQAYPRKQGKNDALKAFQQIMKGKDAPSIDTLLSAMEAQKQSSGWQKEGGRYIPAPGKWLREGRWMDEMEEATSQGGTYDMPEGYVSPYGEV